MLSLEERIANLHQNTLKAPAELIAAAGLLHPSELKPHHLVRRVSANQVKLASALLSYLEPGQLLSKASPGAELPELFGKFWPIALTPQAGRKNLQSPIK